MDRKITTNIVYDMNPHSTVPEGIHKVPAPGKEPTDAQSSRAFHDYQPTLPAYREDLGREDCIEKGMRKIKILKITEGG